MEHLYKGPYTPISASGSVEYDAGAGCDVLVNLTPHPLVIVGLPGPYDARAAAALAAGKESMAVVVPSHGNVRLRESVEVGLGAVTSVDGWVPDCLGGYVVPAVSYSEPEGDLPPMLPGGQHYHAPVDPREADLWPRTGPRVWFVVSLLEAMALRGRLDVLTTGPEIRDASGRIIGCSGLRRVVARSATGGRADDLPPPSATPGRPGERRIRD